MAVDAADARALRRHESHLGDIRRVARQHFGGLRALQRDQRAMLSAQQLHTSGQPRLDMRVVVVLARRVDDQHQHAVLGRVGRARHHQVVEDAAFLVEQLRVALPPMREVEDIGRHQRFERTCRRLVIGTGEERLTHVRDVEQPGGGARVRVLGDDAVAVLHRHVVAGERHHAGAEPHVQIVQRRLRERRVGSLGRVGFGHRRFRINRLLPGNRPA